MEAGFHDENVEQFAHSCISEIENIISVQLKKWGNLIKLYIKSVLDWWTENPQTIPPSHTFILSTDLLNQSSGKKGSKPIPLSINNIFIIYFNLSEIYVSMIQDIRKPLPNCYLHFTWNEVTKYYGKIKF